MKGFEPVTLRVTNTAKHGVARGRRHFRMGETVVVTVTTRPDYLEIKACTYLRVEILDHEPVEDTQPKEGDLSKSTVAELRSFALASNVDLPKRATKAEIIEALHAAFDTPPDADQDESEDQNDQGADGPD